ncbi:MAG: ATP-binding cassette domain-containing protein [Gammaproteobacteria bacterium]|nr:ATP-binding cassette domain-containing protein [Gammaproteobacteria bacterium]NIU03927.1 ATP-binding cassette domain-containing protein [Gammaproteobacteria bacterium]NIV51243.1 ATP-binding cassette domain-containing protein [Gammaproteobacteria bacterium]NIV74890.1 ATP-binding cassette domain-containing protein [Gammaproteobacteria bacterium]NIX85201.1 ATP-binding cassette domain-containing protein [Gammaproteobacteria bacterium]
MNEVEADVGTASPLLSVKDVTLGYGPRTVLEGISFDVPPRGVVALMGPSGVGKSTLIRTIGRWNDTLPSFWASGQALLGDEDLLLTGDVARVRQVVPMLRQKARLYASSVMDNVLAHTADAKLSTDAQRRQLAFELLHPLGIWEEFEPLLDRSVLDLSMGAHKKLLIARLLGRGAKCLLADEPLREVSVAEEAGLIELFDRIGKERAIILVTHNKIEARTLSDSVCFVTGGKLVEAAPTRQFFEVPRTELGRRFLQFGSSWPAADEDSAPGHDRLPKPTASRTVTVPPRDFHWVIPDLLGGMQRPGLLGDVAKDLAALRVLGVKVLMTLTQTPFDPVVLEPFGIVGVHFPIVDMSIPTLASAAHMCAQVCSFVDDEQPTVLHCKAGLGRTGTMLACILVYRGFDAVRAIEAVRTVKPGYIQTEEQLLFVARFAEFLGTAANGATANDSATESPRRRS